MSNSDSPIDTSDDNSDAKRVSGLVEAASQGDAPLIMVQCLWESIMGTPIALYNFVVFVRYPLGLFAVAVLWEHLASQLLNMPQFGSIEIIAVLTYMLRTLFGYMGYVFGILSAWLELLGQALRWLRPDALIKTAALVWAALYRLCASGFAFIESYSGIIIARGWNADVIYTGSLCFLALLVVLRTRIWRALSRVHACVWPDDD